MASTKAVTRKLSRIGMGYNTRSDGSSEVAVWTRNGTPRDPSERFALTVKEAQSLRKFLNRVLGE